MARVLLFGLLADVAGWREADIPGETLAALRAELGKDEDLGQALARPGVQVAVDRVIVRGEAALTAASEVAFMPPMSGG
ncbi:MAG TPA: MoaD/ThiS family protein [Caulobacter sp.]|nr:MoaD/ThiS family protein [Caulobacter sp.]